MDNPTAPPPLVLEYSRPKRKRRGRPLRSSPVGWPINGAAVLLGVLTVYTFTVPGGYPACSLVLDVAWPVLGLRWCVRLAGPLVAGSLGDGGPTRWSVRQWVAAPAVFAASMGLVAADVPVWATFRLNRPALNRAARAALAVPAGASPPAHIGWFGWSTPEVEGPAVYFRVESAGSTDAEGFVYRSDGYPPSRGQAWPLGGGWYRWREPF